MPEVKLTTAQKLAQIRAEARAIVNIPEGAFKIGTDTYVIETVTGKAKITVSSIKDEDFDPAFEAEQYAFEVAEKAKLAGEKKAEADKKKALSIAKKAKAKTEE